MTAFYDTYDSWDLDDQWFVAGYATKDRGAGEPSRVTAQFRPTRRNVIHALEKVYRDNRVEVVPLRMWHKEKETT